MDEAALGSIEYAVENLRSALILVLGHERCCAVSAAVVGGKAPGHIAAVLKAIEPATSPGFDLNRRIWPTPEPQGDRLRDQPSPGRSS